MREGVRREWDRYHSKEPGRLQGHGTESLLTNGKGGSPQDMKEVFLNHKC